MLKRLAPVLFLLAHSLAAALPDPAAHFGFTPGDDYKLADYGQIVSYFEKLAASSDRLRWERFGTTSEGRPMYVAIISSPENLKRLDELRQINRRLALGEATEEEARKLAAEGRAVVWIDSGLHASEVAPAQQAPLLAWRLLGDESEEARHIRDNVILLQVPVINPDGLDAIATWYRGNVGGPHELAPLPRLYQKYADHDNNRDWFMMNLQETREVSRLLYQQWFPQVVYNQHQAPPLPARIFVPPYSEPLNPNIPAPVMEGINFLGAAIRERLARENKPGVLSYLNFDAWWNGGMRSVPAFHNMHGILTETAGFFYATPKLYKPADLPERFANGNPTREPTVFYERPWAGGRWGLRDAIDYMLTVDRAILALAADQRERFLFKAWDLARHSIETGRQGKPYAYIVPGEQWDASNADEMLRRLRLGGITVHRAESAFAASGRNYPAGTRVLLASQPFRGYLVDLMEAQKYPELRTSATGPVKRPYDVAGWTLPLQMGVRVDRIEEPFTAALAADSSDAPAPAPVLDHHQNASFLALADTLARGERVAWTSEGAYVLHSQSKEQYDQAHWKLHKPRVAIYEPWMPNIDAGWTQWLLDTYKVPYTLIHNADLRKGGLRARFDTVLFASQSAASILHGIRAGESTSGRSPAMRDSIEPKSAQRPEFTGGIGIEGLARLNEFLSAGGTVIALDSATELAGYFPIGIRPLVHSAGEGEPAAATGFSCPGSLIHVELDRAEPIAFGMPETPVVFSDGGQAWTVTVLPDFNTGEREVKVIARYARSDLLASGWLTGEKTVLGKPALVDARVGSGHMILFGFRPQHRGQTFGTFKLLLNAVYLASAR